MKRPKKTPGQFEFLFPKLPSWTRAYKARDEAIARDKGGAAWMTHAVDVIHQVAQTKGVFTSDDVMYELRVLPHDNRALGSAMKRAAALRLIKATPNFRPSLRRHATPIRVWAYDGK
jgi:hypothetical protein